MSCVCLLNNPFFKRVNEEALFLFNFFCFTPMNKIRIRHVYSRGIFSNNRTGCVKDQRNVKVRLILTVEMEENWGI